jgi:hypothetical protein
MLPRLIAANAWGLVTITICQVTINSDIYKTNRKYCMTLKMTGPIHGSAIVNKLPILRLYWPTPILNGPAKAKEGYPTNDKGNNDEDKSILSAI